MEQVIDREQVRDVQLVVLAPSGGLIQAAALFAQAQGIVHQEPLPKRSRQGIHDHNALARILFLQFLRGNACTLAASAQSGRERNVQHLVVGGQRLLQDLPCLVRVDLAVVGMAPPRMRS